MEATVEERLSDLLIDTIEKRSIDQFDILRYDKLFGTSMVNKVDLLLIQKLCAKLNNIDKYNITDLELKYVHAIINIIGCIVFGDNTRGRRFVDSCHDIQEFFDYYVNALVYKNKDRHATERLIICFVEKMLFYTLPYTNIEITHINHKDIEYGMRTILLNIFRTCSSDTVDQFIYVMRSQGRFLIRLIECLDVSGRLSSVVCNEIITFIKECYIYLWLYDPLNVDLKLFLSVCRKKVNPNNYFDYILRRLKYEHEFMFMFMFGPIELLNEYIIDTDKGSLLMKYPNYVIKEDQSNIYMRCLRSYIMRVILLARGKNNIELYKLYPRNQENLFDPNIVYIISNFLPDIWIKFGV